LIVNLSAAAGLESTSTGLRWTPNSLGVAGALASNDFIGIYDVDASHPKKVTVSTLSTTVLGSAAVTSYNGTNTNRVLTSGGGDQIDTEPNLTFNGSILAVTGAVSASTTLELGSHMSGAGDIKIGGSAHVANLNATADITGSNILLADNIFHSGDTNTYIGFTNDNFKIVAGGSQMITAYGNLATKRVQIDASDFKVNTSGLDFYITSSTGRVGIGVADPDHALEILSGSASQLKLSYDAANSVTLGASSGGDLVITPSGGDISLVGNVSIDGNTTLGDAAGDTLTINASTVTCGNGLNFDSNTMFISSSNNRIGIGTVTPAAPLEIFNAGTQLKLSYNTSDSATIAVDDSGFLTFTPSGGKTIVKNDLIIQDDVSSDTVVQIFDSSDDGVIAGYANNVITTKIHANGTSYFNGGSVAIGAESAGHSLSISGSFAVSGSSVRARLANSIFEISSSTTIQSGGQALFEVKSPTNPNLFGISEGGVVASNIQPAAFNANLYISGAAVIGAPTAVVPDANLHSGSVSFFLDEGNNKLKFRIRYSTGAMKTGEINLT
jgi:hypothetical protein